MSLKIVVSIVSQKTSTGSQSITNSTLGGLTPKGVIVLMSDATTEASEVAGVAHTMAMSDGSRHRCVSSHIQDNTTTLYRSHSYTSSGASYFIEHVRNADSAPSANRATFTSFDTNGMTINWSSADGTARKMLFIFIAGTDADCYVNHAKYTSGDITSVGFQPSVVLFGNVRSTTLDTGENDWNFGIGLSNGSKNYAIEWFEDYGNCGISCVRNDACLVVYEGDDPSGTDSECTAGSFDSSGFTITRSKGSRDDYFIYMALKFVNANCDFHFIDSKTSTGEQSYTGWGFKPQFALLGFSLHDALNTNRGRDSSPDGRAGCLGLGIIDNSNEQAIGHRVQQANPYPNPTVAKNYTRARAIDFKQHDGTTAYTAIKSSFDSDGFTLNYTAANATARKILVLAVQEESVSGAAAKFLHYQRLRRG